MARISDMQLSALKAAPLVFQEVKEMRLQLPQINVDFVANLLAVSPKLDLLSLSTNQLVSSSPSSFRQPRISISKVELELGRGQERMSCDAFFRLFQAFSVVESLHVSRLFLDNTIVTPPTNAQIQSVTLSSGVSKEACGALARFLDPRALTSIDDRTRDGYLLDFQRLNRRFSMVTTIVTELKIGSREHAARMGKKGALAHFPRLSELELVLEARSGPEKSNASSVFGPTRKILAGLSPLRTLTVTIELIFDTYEDSEEGPELERREWLELEWVERKLRSMDWRLLQAGIDSHTSSLETIHIEFVTRAHWDKPKDAVEEMFKTAVPPLCSSDPRLQELCTTSVDYMGQYSPSRLASMLEYVHAYHVFASDNSSGSHGLYGSDSDFGDDDMWRRFDDSD